MEERKTENEAMIDKGHRRRVLKENLTGWGIIGPIILYFAIFGIIPLVIVFRYSFMEDSLFNGTKFVGFRNFATIFTNPAYYKLLLTTLIIAVFTIGLSLVLGMGIALLITGPIRGKGVYRTIYYVPVVVSMAVIAQIASVWLNYNNGTMNNLITALGGNKIAWKDSTFWMYFWIIVICVWKGIGATIILFVAGLNAIPKEIYEAAELDGATGFTKFFRITLPQLRPMLVFVIITSIIGAFNIFEPVQLISEGGPNGSTMVVLYQIYNESFQNGNFGMGSALSVVVLFILMALTMLSMKVGDKKED